MNTAVVLETLLSLSAFSTLVAGSVLFYWSLCSSADGKTNQKTRTISLSAAGL